MAIKHGNKIYYQVLLDPARAMLLEQLADDKGLKATALARQAIYDWLYLMSEPEVIEVAEAIDKSQWRQSVLNRVLGRQRSRKSCNSSKQVF